MSRHASFRPACTHPAALRRLGAPVAAALRVALLAGAAALAAPAAPAADALRAPEAPPRNALDRYVNAGDPHFSWRLLSSEEQGGVTSYLLELTSQRWRSETEVDRTLWKHWLRISRPEGTRSDTALLVIGGGRNDGKPPRPAGGMTPAIALASHAVVAELGMVPNQPLTFAGDGRPRKEDDLIAYTWNRFLDTGDPTWAARFPMVKSAARAMDAIIAFLASPAGGALDVRKFVVAGGSKRGWTTWLTGAVDSRVVAIVPIVIDVLNVIPSMDHHRAAYGFWSPAVGDYVRNGIMGRRHHPAFRKLMALVDPFSYRRRLTMPKLIINACGDQFFLPDSSRFYFDDLPGEKHLRYVPNADHSLKGSDAVATLQAFFQSIVEGTPRPDLSWKMPGDGTVTVTTHVRPEKALLWQATNPKARDFRLMEIGRAWTSSPVKIERTGTGEGAAVYSGTARVGAPEKGWTAYLVEVTFPATGASPLKLTTAVAVTPDTLPFPSAATEEKTAESPLEAGK